MKQILKYIFLTCLFSLSLSSSFAKERVWVDFDLSMGKKFADVDDGYALISAATSPHLDIEGLSLIFGNTNDIDFMERSTKDILKRINRQDLLLYRGALRKEDNGLETDATMALAKALSDGPLKIIATGRMTNIASTVLLYPQLRKNITEIVVNFGRRLEYEVGVSRRNLIMPDTNVDGDVEAVRTLIDYKIPITLIPTELMFDQLITRSRMNKLKQGNQIAQWMRKESLWWKRIWSIYPGIDGFIPWDVFTVGYLTDRSDYHCLENILISLKKLSNNTIRNVRNLRRPKQKEFVVASPSLKKGTIGKYCFDVNDEHLDKWVSRWMSL